MGKNTSNRMAEAAAPRERTYIMIKPDGVQRGLVGAIMQRFEQKGFKLVAMKLCSPGRAHMEQHYADLSGRKMLGATKPFDSAPGTIRGDYCIDVGRNIIHGSDSVESANHEIGLWFKPEELCAWEDHSAAWVYE